ncbi:MAG TPA: RNA polymerase sigma factor [Chloroflexi bacterium]|nr:RNA polymerase sigma factor [Chloroflexota bacterium]
MKDADGQLVTRMQAGDLDALGKLYQRYKSMVYRTAFAITRDERTAEDILQETFLRVYTYADSIDETLPLGPWLYRVTVNQSYTWTNRVKRWFYSVQDVLDRWMAPSRWLPEKAAEEEEWRRILRQAIDALPPKHRIVVILHYLEGLSLKEISYVIDVPEGTVKSRLYYARESLRETILERDHRLVPEVAYDFT